MKLLLFTLTVFLSAGAAARAATFTFDTDPLAGTTVRSTPGRQVVGGELFINFNVATDKFLFDADALGISNQITFGNDFAANLPTGGLNAIVLRDLDNDNNPGTPFGAGNAADLIAARVTTPGPGVFIYFNGALNLPRLVYSTDLNDNTADLKILARMLNLSNDPNSLGTFSAANFGTTTPEPSSLLLVAGGAFLLLRKRLY